MKRIILVIFWGIVACSLIFQGACKTADEADDSQFTLSVNVSEGISGAPAPGTYTYSQGETVSYYYALMEGYRNMTVTLDGAPVPDSGMITISGNHTLEARVGTQLDVRGKWTGMTVWRIAPTYILDVFTEVTFEGGLSSGTVKCNVDLFPYIQHGDFSISGNEVEFEVSLIPSPLTLHFWGSAENDNRITGKFEYGFAYLTFLKGDFWLNRE